MHSPNATATFSFEAIGTSWQIETEEPLDQGLCTRLLERVERFEWVYSRFRADSLVSELARARHGGRFEFPDDSLLLFELYDQLHAMTEGAIDPLVGRDLELLGYDPAYSLCLAPEQVRRAHALERPSWASDVVRNGLSLTTRRALVIDVGAAGKGLLVDILCAMLRGAGITHFVVDGSGDLRHAGPVPLRVGLEDPRDGERVIGTVDMCGRAVCASGVNRRAWREGLHHLLDARTGSPVRDVIGTWAIADNAMTADGIASALFFTPAETLARRFNCSGVRMFSDGRVEYSANFDGELFTS